MADSDDRHEEKVDRVMELTVTPSGVIKPANVHLLLKAIVRKFSDDELDELYWNLR